MPKTKNKPVVDGGWTQILKVTGLDKDDVMAYNEERRTLVTFAGGKYRLDADGKSVHHLAGPVLPGLITADRVELEARREAAENSGER